MKNNQEKRYFNNNQLMHVLMNQIYDLVAGIYIICLHNIFDLL